VLNRCQLDSAILGRKSSHRWRHLQQQSFAEAANKKLRQLEHEIRSSILVELVTGGDFPKVVQKLTVTLNFIEPADRTQIGVPVGPQQESPAFKFIEELAKKLHIFKGSLKSVTINLGVPQTIEKSFTTPQAMFVLLFYNLCFVDWVCCFFPSLTYETSMCKVAY
jgi:hypothetical protein